METKKISLYIEKNATQLINKLKELISTNIINHPPCRDENNGQEIIEEIFKDLGLKIDRFSPDEVNGFKESKIYLKGRVYKNRDNLVFLKVLAL